MERPKSTKINTVLRNTILAGAAVVVILTVGAGGQQGLGELVTMSGFEWLIGNWEATTDEGDKVDLVYKWELNKNLITLGFKVGDFEGRGMIYYVPAENKVVQIGVDNRGGVAKGTWDADGEKAVARLEYTPSTPADGVRRRMASVLSKVDANTMKEEFYEMDSDGWFAEETLGTLEYKRQKKQTKKNQGDAPVQ
ncbi:MAG: hypothetical protein HQ580_07095 [Planctomycetes bacterium]|nr:hypothetical protein [Planctomycetota bacterium]